MWLLSEGGADHPSMATRSRTDQTGAGRPPIPTTGDTGAARTMLLHWATDGQWGGRVQQVGILRERLSRGLTWLRSKWSRGSAGQRARPAFPELQKLRERAAGATPSFRPQYSLEAARLARSLDMESDALSLYGDAIDGYLESGRDRAAEVVCREVLNAYPHVVRARRTLALIALGRGEAQEAAALLQTYAETAKRFGEERLTRTSLRAMGLLSGLGPVQQQAIAELRALGDESGVEMVLSRKDLPRDEVFPTDAGLWGKALETALLDADDLRDHGYR